MISDIIQAIADKLAELYSGYKIYVDDVTQNFSTPSFLIVLANQEYGKRISGTCAGASKATFDVAYFSDKEEQDIKSDCRTVQENLLREIDLIGDFRAMGKNAQITDNVLHIIFDVRYSEIRVEAPEKMNAETINTKFIF